MEIYPMAAMPLDPMVISQFMEKMRREHDDYGTSPQVSSFLDERSCAGSTKRAVGKLIDEYSEAGPECGERLMLAQKIDKALPIFGSRMNERDWQDLRDAFTYFALDVTSERLAALGRPCAGP